MAEEFEESELIFQDQDYYFNNIHHNHYLLTKEQESTSPTNGNTTKKMSMKNNNNYMCHNININNNINVKTEESWKTRTGSLPMEIPIRKVYDGWIEEEYNEGEVVPPHVIIGTRRVAGKMAFSVCSGNGRTLKGRDLSQVRNSILKLTGFLET